MTIPSLRDWNRPFDSAIFWRDCTYQNSERMTREAKLEILMKVADRFGVSLDDLVGRTDNKTVLHQNKCAGD